MDFEQKLTNIIEIVKTKPNVVIFVDEGHMLVNLGDSSDGATSAGNIIKPYITRGELRMILATTNDEYTKHILPNKAFARRFHEVKINEPTAEETREILIGLLPVETKFFSREIQLDLVDHNRFCICNMRFHLARRSIGIHHHFSELGKGSGGNIIPQGGGIQKNNFHVCNLFFLFFPISITQKRDFVKRKSIKILVISKKLLKKK